MKIISVTGTPGTGKTTFSKALSRKLGYLYIDVGSLIKKHALADGYDRSLKTYLVDEKKLSTFLLSYLSTLKQKGVILDSHLSHYLPCEKIDLCYILTCNLKILRKRLKKRGYSEKKIRDNLEAEAFETLKIEAQERGHTIKVIDTSGKARS